MKRIVIIGATSSIAMHCARIWAKDSVDLTLVGRNQQKLEVSAQDLKVRSSQSLISTRVVDFQNIQAIEALVSELTKTPVDIALIAHGSLPSQEESQRDLALCKETLVVNGISPVLFAESFVAHMERYNKGSIAIIGSIAGDRGRKSNYIYGSAKGLLTRYAQGLQHRLANTGVKVILIKPGLTDTPMTAKLKGKGVKKAPPNVVAKCIVDGVNTGKSTIYAPAKWTLIMMVIRHLPSVVFNRLNI